MLNQRKKNWLSWTVIAVWLIATSVFLFWWRFADFGIFDQQSEWLDQAPSRVNVTGDVIFHVRSGCLCDPLADRHDKLIQQYDQYQQRRVKPAEMEALGIPVPATPMLVIVEQGKVIYSGPYATGPTCSPEQSFLPQLLDSERRITTPWYNGNVKACRCVLE
ncbi:DUF6436 domain-containing protein [Idiomarina seosinensis]|uniref:DUF6436 domain-containing protein n=1 Tax=Idiomarina seosinensis TaxID=281739 RepID=UPI00384F07C0